MFLMQLEGLEHLQTFLVAEKLMQDDAREIVEVVLEATKGGDMTAARLILERIAPVRKGRPVYFDLPPISNAEDVAAAMEALTTAMASGEVTPDEAATVASVLEIRRKTLEIDELMLRVKALRLCPRLGHDIPRFEQRAQGRQL